MKTMCAFLMYLILSVAIAVSQTQSPAAAIHHSNSEEVSRIVGFLEPRILAVAEAMPAAKYSFVPTGGEFTAVRNFAEQLKHIAADNYLDGAAVLGENPPGNVGAGESGSTAVEGKDEIVAYVRESFTYLRRAAQRIDNENAEISKPSFLPYGPSVTTRLHIMLANIGHTQDHYGQLVEYLRMNGIVPPESQPRNASAVSQALDFWISNTEKEVVSAADAMPEGKYSFAPRGRAFTGVRTFAEQIKHLAANNYRMAAYILEKMPSADQEAETGPPAVRSKAEIMDYLKGSFVALHEAVASINEANMAEPVSSHRTSRENTRLQFAVDAVAHSYDHYGQMVEYLRMNTIVPPPSRR